MKQLLILCLISISLCSFGQTPVKELQCTAITKIGEQCKNLTGIAADKYPAQTEHYCWLNSQKHLMWRNCIEQSHYSDGELSNCDSMYGNKSFDMTKPTLIIKAGIVYAYDGY